MCNSVRAPPPLPQALRTAFSLDQRLQFDSQSSGNLYLENSLEDHGVSGQLVLDKITFEDSVPQRCRALQLALTAHQLLRRREGVSILGDIAPSQKAFFLSLQLLDMSHRRWSSCNASVALEFGDIHSLATAAFVTSKLLLGRGLDVAPQQQQHPLPPGPGPPQPVRTLPGLLTALAASLDRRWPQNALTLHTSWTVQEVIAAGARILKSIHYEVGTYSPADWVHLLVRRFSQKAEQIRQRTPPAVRSPLSLTVVPVEVMRSALLVTAGFARDCPLAPDITPSCFVVCYVFALGVSSSC